MVDFNKIREENKRKAEQQIKETPATIIRPAVNTDLVTLRHLKDYHLGNLTEWEANFVQNNFNYLINNPDSRVSAKVKAKIGDIVAELCGSDCAEQYTSTRS